MLTIVLSKILTNTFTDDIVCNIFRETHLNISFTCNCTGPIRVSSLRSGEFQYVELTPVFFKWGFSMLLVELLVRKVEC